MARCKGPVQDSGKASSFLVVDPRFVKGASTDQAVLSTVETVYGKGQIFFMLAADPRDLEISVWGTIRGISEKIVFFERAGGYYVKYGDVEKKVPNTKNATAGALIELSAASVRVSVDVDQLGSTYLTVRNERKNSLSLLLRRLDSAVSDQAILSVAQEKENILFDKII